MPNPRMNAAKMKAEALKKSKANKMKSKMGSPAKKTGKAKPAAAVKNAKVYKKIKSTSTYKPKLIKESDEKLEMASPAKNTGKVKRKTTVDKSEKNKRSKITTKNRKSGKVVVKRTSKDTSPDGGKRKVKVKTVSDDAGVLSKKTKRKDSKGFKEKEKTKVKVKGKKTVGVKSKSTMTGKKAGYKGKDTFKRESSTTNKYGNVVGGKYTKMKMNMTEKDSPAKMSGRSYDMKMAYDKKLTPKARLHYLENERHDAPGKMKGSPYHMKHGDSPMHKDLVGKQHNLPEHLKKKIEAAPQMKGSPYHMSNELKYGGPVIDQMKTLSQAGASKVLRHMKK